MTKLQITETDIRRQVQDYLRLMGWFVYYNLQGLGSYPGLSDLVAVKNGRVVHVEIKKPGGRQSERQKEFQRRLEAAGGEYVLAKRIEDVEHLVKRKRGLDMFQLIKRLFVYWFYWPRYGYEVHFRPDGQTVFKKVRYRG